MLYNVLPCLSELKLLRLDDLGTLEQELGLLACLPYRARCTNKYLLHRVTPNFQHRREVIVLFTYLQTFALVLQKYI